MRKAIWEVVDYFACMNFLKKDSNKNSLQEIELPMVRKR